MIPFASQRGGGQDLAAHLLNAHDNEIAEVVHLRGAIAEDLHGAFKEWEAQAEILTRCRKYLYSLSINPDPEQGPLTRAQYLDYIARTEEALGLAEQPRAIVFHTKYGREHCHVVWSRIDADQQRAVHIAFDREKLMRVTRSFAREHRLDLPGGYDKSRQVGQISLYEKEQERQTGLSKADHASAVTQAWRHSDSPQAFVHALAERGYILATGKRPYVLVDLYGGMHALPKLIEDKSVRTNDIRKFLGQDFPVESLPTVEEARELVTAHRKQVEKEVDERRGASRLAALRHAQGERRKDVSTKLAELNDRHAIARHDGGAGQRQERDKLRMRSRTELLATRQQRREGSPQGFAALLSKVTGVTLLQSARARRADSKHVKLYLREKKELSQRQTIENGALLLRQKMQRLEIERQLKSLDRLDRREVAALMRDLKSEQRTQERDNGASPSLAALSKQQDRGSPREAAPDLQTEFKNAKRREFCSIPDVLSEFARAAHDKSPEKQIDDSDSAHNVLHNINPDRQR